jgi:hypothetical protein
MRIAAEELRKQELQQAVKRRAERLSHHEARAITPPQPSPASPAVPRLPVSDSSRQQSIDALRSVDASPRPGSASDSPRGRHARSGSPRQPRKHRASSSSPRRAERPFQPHVNARREGSQNIVSRRPRRSQRRFVHVAQRGGSWPSQACLRACVGDAPDCVCACVRV